MVAKIEKSTFNVIRQLYLRDPFFNQTQSCNKLHICRTTMRKYVKECIEIKRLYPKRLKDVRFRLPLTKKVLIETRLHRELITALPSLIDAVTLDRVLVLNLWEDYNARFPFGYSLTQFSLHYRAWRLNSNICQYSHRRVRNIGDEERMALVKWTKSYNHKSWERATAILGSFDRKPVKEMAIHLNRSVKCILRWIDNFNREGIAGLIDAPYTTNEFIVIKVQEKQNRLVKILQETPQIHGLNRASWKLEDLALVYQKIYGEYISDSCVSALLKKAGYGYRKSRERLTSPDPDFKLKLDNIKSILSRLKPTERFFSVDEYGHFSVNVKGGRSYAMKNDNRIVNTSQKSKGYLIVTAALELSSNQITHFYSRFKNTDEMIKLLHILLLEYKSNEKLFFSWDCASWHASKKLYKEIDLINTTAYRKKNRTPVVELAPLPASAQFLNIIESVFSGLAKSVIHNSDYDSIEACMTAIDRHFRERNLYFLRNPKRAGKKIWGNEVVNAEFKEVNNCKKRVSRARPL